VNSLNAVGFAACSRRYICKEAHISLYPDVLWICNSVAVALCSLLEPGSETFCVSLFIGQFFQLLLILLLLLLRRRRLLVAL